MSNAGNRRIDLLMAHVRAILGTKDVAPVESASFLIADARHTVRPGGNVHSRPAAAQSCDQRAALMHSNTRPDDEDEDPERSLTWP